MKVIKKSTRGEKTRGVTLRLPEILMEKVDAVADENGVSRQALIAAIIRSALNDKNLRIEL